MGARKNARTHFSCAHLFPSACYTRYVSQRIWPTLPLLAINPGCTLSEVSVILDMYFKGKMNHCILYSLTTFYYSIIPKGHSLDD